MYMQCLAQYEIKYWCPTQRLCLLYKNVYLYVGKQMTLVKLKSLTHLNHPIELTAGSRLCHTSLSPNIANKKNHLRLFPAMQMPRPHLSNSDRGIVIKRETESSHQVLTTVLLSEEGSLRQVSLVAQSCPTL